MKIYLAGKMDREYGAWRDAVVGHRWDHGRQDEVPHWVLLRDGEYSEDRICAPWPKTPNTHVLGIHEYAGPYRTEMRSDNWEWKDLGEFHGSKVAGSHGQSNGDEDGLIVKECRDAIARSDLFVAYVNRPDCFGTLVELGLARALGVFTVLAVEDGAEWDWSDYWFAATMSATVQVPDPVEVGSRPKRPDGAGYSREYAEEESAWFDRREAERNRVRGLVRDAIVCWTARPEKPNPVVSLVRPEDDTARLLAALRDSANAFAQIGHWSADPRVRNEAQRMLKRLTG